jgi:hypothetical protein
MCQGTTLVVPQMTHSDFPALAAAEWQIAEDKETQGLNRLRKNLLF